VRAALAVLLLLPLGSAWAAGPHSAAAPSEAGALCLPAIAAAERATGIPAGLLRSIALVESGRPDPASGRTVPWPWTINAEGAGRTFETKAQAVAATRALLAAGVRSIDVGCAQVNLHHHPQAFDSLEAAFDPATNLGYAARFLLRLRATTGSWAYAAAGYHSQTPEFGHAYAQRVMAVWPDAAQYGPWPPAPAGHAAGARPLGGPARPDYSLFTRSFAERVRRMDRDRDRQLAELRALVASNGVRLPPAPVPVVSHRPPARDAAPRPVRAEPPLPGRVAALPARRGT
jgi:hypothetical protein